MGGAIHGVATGRHVAEPFADDDEQVGAADRRRHLRVDVEAGVADVRRVPVVEMVLAAKRGNHGQVERRRELADVHGCRLAPAATAEHEERPLGSAQFRLEARHLAGRRRQGRRLRRRAVARLGAGEQDILRQAEDHRPGAPGARRVEGTCHEFGNAFGLADDADPIGDIAEHGFKIDLLESAATFVGALDQSDEEHHRRGVVVRYIDPARRIRGARRPRDEGNTRHARQLAGGLCHHRGAALVATDDGADRGGVE